MQASVFEKPRGDFIRMEDKGYDTELKPIVEKVDAHLGNLFYQNVFEEGQTLSHSQLAMWIGQTAVKLIPDTSMRQWSTTIDDQKELEETLWSRAVWMLVHILPVGFIVARHRFTNQGYSWNPALKALRKSATASNSNRLFSGMPISQSVMHKLFPDVIESEHAMLTFAIINTFADKPNSDNPFYNAIRDAIRMTLIRHPYPIPYFWRDFIEAFLSYNPQDLMAFQAAQSKLSRSDVPFNHQEQERPEMTDSDAEPAPIPQPAAQPAKVESVPIAVTPPSLSEPVPAPVESVQIKESQFHKEALAELYASWGQYASEPKRQAICLRDIVLYWSKIVSEKVQSGQFPVNSASAFAYVTESGVYITEGGMIRMLKLVDDNLINWQDWMVHSGLLLPDDGVIRAKTKQIELKVWKIRDRVASNFIPDLETFSPSDVFNVSDKSVY